MTFEESVDFLKALNLIEADIVADVNKPFYLDNNQASRTFRTRMERSDDLTLPAYWRFKIDINIVSDIDRQFAEDNEVFFSIGNIESVPEIQDVRRIKFRYYNSNTLFTPIKAKHLDENELRAQLIEKLKIFFKYIDEQEKNYLEYLDEKEEAEKEKEAKRIEYVNSIKLTNVDPDAREAILKFIDNFSMKTYKDDYDLVLRFYNNGVDEITQEELTDEDIKLIVDDCDLDPIKNEVKKYIVKGSIYDTVEIQGNYETDYYKGDSWDSEDVEVAIDDFELPIYTYKEDGSNKLIVDDFEYDFGSSGYWDDLQIPEWDD